MGDWIVLIDEDDLAEQLDVVDKYLHQQPDHVRSNIEGRYSDPNDDRDSRAWMVRFALDEHTNILGGNPGVMTDPDLTAPPPKRRPRARGKARKRSTFATVR